MKMTYLISSLWLAEPKIQLSPASSYDIIPSEWATLSPSRKHPKRCQSLLFYFYFAMLVDKYEIRLHLNLGSHRHVSCWVEDHLEIW